MQHAGIEIYVLPAEAKKLRATEAGKQIKGNGRTPLDRLLQEKLEHSPCFRLIQISRLALGQGRKLRPLCGIHRDAVPLDGFLQNGGKRPVIGVDGGRRERLAVADQIKEGFRLLVQRRCNRVGGAAVNGCRRWPV